MADIVGDLIGQYALLMVCQELDLPLTMWWWFKVTIDLRIHKPLQMSEIEQWSDVFMRVHHHWLTGQWSSDAMQQWWKCSWPMVIMAMISRFRSSQLVNITSGTRRCWNVRRGNRTKKNWPKSMATSKNEQTIAAASNRDFHYTQRSPPIFQGL